MPNRVFYTDSKTTTKVFKALTQNGGLGLDDAIDVVERLQAANLEIVENAPKGATASPPETE